MNITSTKQVLGLYAASIVTAFGVAAGISFGIPAIGNAMSSEQVQEDDPGWDCRSMGNRICGVVGEDRSTYLVYFDERGVAYWVEPRS